MENRICVVLASCHGTVRAGLREFLATDPGLIVVGEASTAGEALQLVAERHPDIVVDDLHLPGLTCQELFGALKAGFPRVAILVLTLVTDDPYRCALREAGADVCLAKQTTCDELVAAVKTLGAATRRSS